MPWHENLSNFYSGFICSLPFKSFKIIFVLWNGNCLICYFLWLMTFFLVGWVKAASALKIAMGRMIAVTGLYCISQWDDGRSS